MGAPRVVAKGADLIALRIREIAEANGVPMVENPPLARALYAGVELDREIPPDTTRQWPKSSATCSASRANSGRAQPNVIDWGRWTHDAAGAHRARRRAGEEPQRHRRRVRPRPAGCSGLAPSRFVCAWRRCRSARALRDVEARRQARLLAAALVGLAGCRHGRRARPPHACALGGRLALLSQALEASPKAHLIVGAGRRLAYANAAFRRFFPARLAPLETLGQRRARDDPAADDFARLRRDARERGSARGARLRRAGCHRLVQRLGPPAPRQARLQPLDFRGHHRAPRDGAGDPRRAAEARRFSRQCADRLLLGRWRGPLPLCQPGLGRLARRHARRVRRRRRAACPLPCRAAAGRARRTRPSTAAPRARSAARSCCKAARAASSMPRSARAS